MEPVRPLPDRPVGDCVRSWLAWFGVARLVAAAVSVAVVAVGGWWLLHAPPPPVEQSLPFASAPSSTVSAEAPSPPTVTATAASTPPSTVEAVPAEVVVQAAGEVVRPGVYRLPVGARVADLVAAAGGPTAIGDPNVLSLAAVLVDGDRVRVPERGTVVEPSIVPVNAGGAGGRSSGGGGGGAGGAGGVGSAPSKGGSGAGAPASPLDLNRASADELDALPGVGPATAAAIVAHREKSGPFASIDDLLDVRGIGPAKLDGLRDLVTV